MDKILDLPAGQRKALFLGVVVFLFALVAWSWVSNSRDDAAQAQQAQQAQQDQARRDAANPPPASSQPSQQEEDDVEDEEPVRAGTTGEDPAVPVLDALTEIPLPVSQDDLDQAVEVSDTFMTNYLSYSYDTPAEEWADSVRPHTSSDLYGQTTGGYPDGPLLERMIEQETRTAAEVNVVKIGLLSKDSIMLEVVANVVTTTTDGITDASYQNQITLTRMGQEWKVSSVYPTGTGDLGAVDPDTYGYDPAGGLSDGQPVNPADDTTTDDGSGEGAEPSEGDTSEGDGTDP